MRHWILFLRPVGSKIRVTEAYLPGELVKNYPPAFLALRERYQPETHLFTFTTKTEITDPLIVLAATDRLSQDELRRMYNLPQHPIVAAKHTSANYWRRRLTRKNRA